MLRPITVDITNPEQFHCFSVTFHPKSGEKIEIMLHASALVDLIHECSVALCAWQRQTTTQLICEKTGFSEDEARKAGLIA